jgi:hypothetical protein
MGMSITSTAKTGIRYLICTKDSGKDKKTYRVGSKEAKRAQVERDNWWNCIAKQVRGMQNHSISPKADNKVHPLMQLTAHHLRQRFNQNDNATNEHEANIPKTIYSKFEPGGNE